MCPTMFCGCMHVAQVKGELDGRRVVAVAAGREHALAVTSEGRVYSWGGRDLVTGRAAGTGGFSQPGLVGGDLAADKILFVAGGEVGPRCSVCCVCHCKPQCT